MKQEDEEEKNLIITFAMDCSTEDAGSTITGTFI